MGKQAETEAETGTEAETETDMETRQVKQNGDGEKEVEEKITVQPAAVEVAPSSSSSPAPLERLKGWMDERDMEENFESSIEEFKAKLAAAQDALIVLQDQMERSKRNKNNQKW